MRTAHVPGQESLPGGDARSKQECAIDEFLAETDERFGPVPEEVLAGVRSAWPE
jgi:hypothetical protein